MTYGQFTPEELKTYCPTVVLVDEKNQVVEVRRYNDLLTGSSFSVPDSYRIVAAL